MDVRTKPESRVIRTSAADSRAAITKEWTVHTRHGLGQTSTVVQAIITQENANPSDNNPGNLTDAGQPGATSGPNDLAVFDTYQDGITRWSIN